MYKLEKCQLLSMYLNKEGGFCFRDMWKRQSVTLDLLTIKSVDPLLLLPSNVQHILEN
jgi:hypothetical protein